jgi:hypothetical protein
VRRRWAVVALLSGEREARAVERYEAHSGTPPWWDLVNVSVPLGPEDVARLAADVDIDDLDDADWFAVAPALCRWPRWDSTNRQRR